MLSLVSTISLEPETIPLDLKVVLVGDRGMLTETRIDDLRRHPELGWVSALRASAVRKLAEQNGGVYKFFKVENKE